MNSKSFCHDFASFALIRVRVSSQLEVSASPDSTSSILLSISEAQAASTSASLLSSRLAINSEASQARSFGGSANAVSRIVSALVLIDDQSSKSNCSREYGKASKLKPEVPKTLMKFYGLEWG
jgi:hypothetical protein